MFDILDSTAARKEEFYCVVIKPLTLVAEIDFWHIGRSLPSAITFPEGMPDGTVFCQSSSTPHLAIGHLS